MSGRARSRPRLVWGILIAAAAVGALGVLFQSWLIVLQVAFGFLVGVITARLSDRPVRRLTARGRERFAQVMDSGEASGDNHIDRLALRRLGRAAKDTPRSQRAFLICMLALAAGVEIAAAIVRSPWWAVAAAASVGALVIAARRPLRADNGAEAKYQRLLSQTSPHVS